MEMLTQWVVLEPASQHEERAMNRPLETIIRRCSIEYSL